MRTLILIALVFAPCSAWAHIGSTLAECEEKYGASEGGNERTSVFFVGPLVYVCDFNQATGKCESMMVTTKMQLPLTKAEIESVLDENAMEGEWAPDESEGRDRWKHSSGTWVAGVTDGRLVIQREFR